MTTVNSLDRKKFLVIKFSEPWDKLQRLDSFTTIRRYTPEKMEYYYNSMWKEFLIELNGKFIGKAVLIGVHHTCPLKIAGHVLKSDFSLHGKINNEWYKKIMNMGSVILLYFDRRY